MALKIKLREKNNMNNITVIGDGGWGTALALVLERNNHNVTVWGYSEENINSIIKNKENKNYLPGISIPSNIKWTASPEESVSSADLIVIVIPSKFYINTIESFFPFFNDKHLIVSATKGIDLNTGKTMSAIAADIIGRKISVLSGPSHAEEVAKSIPCAVAVASEKYSESEQIQKYFMNDFFRVYTSTDCLGVELGGALKNVIAIAAGVSDGLGYGDNAKAAIITRGLYEITKLGVAMGANKETFTGLSGIGDLIVTCTSKHSRNRNAGEKIGRGEHYSDIAKDSMMVIEGFDNCAAAVKLSTKYDLKLPIINQVQQILFENKNPEKAMKELMNRSAKSEL